MKIGKDIDSFLKEKKQPAYEKDKLQKMTPVVRTVSKIRNVPFYIKDNGQALVPCFGYPDDDKFNLSHLIETDPTTSLSIDDITIQFSPLLEQNCFSADKLHSYIAASEALMFGSLNFDINPFPVSFPINHVYERYMDNPLLDKYMSYYHPPVATKKTNPIECLAEEDQIWMRNIPAKSSTIITMEIPSKALNGNKKEYSEEKIYKWAGMIQLRLTYRTTLGSLSL